MLPRVPRAARQLHPEVKCLLSELVAGKHPWPLMLTGEAGVGKTCFALCLMDFAGGFFHRMEDFARLVNRCKFGRESIKNDWGTEVDFTEEMLWDQLSRASFAVLDEIGTRADVTDAHYQALYGFLAAREFKPHVVISNKSLDALCGAEVDADGKLLPSIYDHRITSRLSAGTVVELKGADRRREGRGG